MKEDKLHLPAWLATEGEHMNVKVLRNALVITLGLVCTLDFPMAQASTNAAKVARTHLPGYGAISGKVTEAKTGLPLSNVEVYACGPTSTIYYHSFPIGCRDDMANGLFKTTTDSQGLYSITDLWPSSDYIVQVEPPSNKPYLIREWYDNHQTSLGDSVVVHANEITTGINIQMDAGSSIRGTVKTADTNDVVPNARIKVTRNGIHFPANVSDAYHYADAAGQYKLDRLPSGRYDLEIRVNPSQRRLPFYTSYMSATASITLPSPQTIISLDIALRRGPIITATVLGADTGLPQRQVEVQLFQSDNLSEIIDGGITDETGIFPTMGLAPGQYVLLFKPSTYYVHAEANQGYYKSAYYNQKANGLVADHITVITTSHNLDIRLLPELTIKGNVVAKDTGKVLSFIPVKVYNFLDGEVYSKALFEFGSPTFFVSNPLLPGTYSVKAVIEPHSEGLKNYYQTTAYTRTITLTDTPEAIQLVADREPQIVGTVSDIATDLPIEDACVFASKEGEYRFSSNNAWEGNCSDSKGHYNISVPVGAFTLRYYPLKGKRPFIETTLPYSVTTLQPNTSYTVNVKVQRGGYITGLIREAENGKSTKARIDVYNSDTGELMFDTVDLTNFYNTNVFDDLFVSGALPSGKYKIKISPYIYLCHKIGCNTDPYFVEYFNDQPTFEQANVITVTEPNATNIGMITMDRIPPWFKQKRYFPLVNR